MAFTKPSNLSGTIAFQAVQPGAADITFAARAIGFAGLGETAILNNITSVSTEAFSAGVLQENTLDYTAVVASDDTVYTLAIRRNDTGQVITYQIITPSSGTNASLIAELFDDQINNDLSAVVTSSRAVAVLTVTEKSVDTQGVSYIVTSGVVDTETVAHVDQSGTLAEVQVYDPSVTAGDYRKYTIFYDKLINAPNGGKWFSPVVMVVWANELDVTNEAAFLARFDEIMAASNLADAAAEPYVEVV